MKKFIIALTLLMLPTAVSAALYTFDSDTEANMGAVGVFDKDGRLTAVEKTTLSVENGNLITADISVSGEAVKLFLPDGTIIPNGTIKHEEAPTPPSYDDTLYKSKRFALTAPALVKKVLVASEDGEDVYKLTLLYQGEEKVLTFDSDLLIASASDRYSDALGKDASYLRSGDVIVLNYMLKDRPDNICLIYRADTTEPIFNSEISSFLPLYTNSTSLNKVWSTNLKNEVAYRFGVVSDVTDKSLALTENELVIIELSRENLVKSRVLVLSSYFM